jgi:hypothetical protein
MRLWAESKSDMHFQNETKRTTVRISFYSSQYKYSCYAEVFLHQQ